MQNALPRRASTRSTLPVFILVFALLLMAFEASANRQENLQETDSRTLAFDVFLENRPIGNHQFTLSNQNGTSTNVDITADFKVKILFVTAFSYLHNNRETWRDGCLQSINATTLMNGEAYKVAGNATERGFRLAEKEGQAEDRETTESCARSFAYWDRDLLSKGNLLNSQTGEFTNATLEPLGTSTMQIGSNTLPVTRYSLQGKDVQVTLSYATTGAEDTEEWVGLESTVKGGRTLRYVRTPDSLTANQQP